MSYTVRMPAYTVGCDAYTQFPGICAPLGRRFLLIGGRIALEQGLPRLKAALAGSPLEISACERFGDDCTTARIGALCTLAKDLSVDFIAGMGGGKALDTAKGAAFEAGLPVVTLPTIAATCAAVTALSVVYREDKVFERFYFYPAPPFHCFIDTAVIARAPEQYLRAGIGDTIGKHFESRLSARGDRLGHSSVLGIAISDACYGPLLEHGAEALEQCRENRTGDALEQVVLANTVSTGLVSLMVEDCYNCAVAHSLFYGLAALDHFEEQNLHGDVVAYGVLVQLAIDGEFEEMKRLYSFLRQIGIFTSLSEMGVPFERKALKSVLTATVSGPDMEHLPYLVTEDMVFQGICTVERYHALMTC